MSCECNVITEVCVVKGSTVVLMARVKTPDGDYITQSDVSSVRVDLYEMDDEERTAVDSDGAEIEANSDDTFDAYDEPDATDVIFDTFQTDDRWQSDSTGYDVAYKIAMPDFGIYEARVSITLANDDVIVVLFGPITSR
jgi:hypothetical protein